MSYQYESEIVEIVDTDEYIRIYGKFGTEKQDGNRTLIGRIEIEDDTVNLHYEYHNMASSIYDDLVKACKQFGYNYQTT